MTRLTVQEVVNDPALVGATVVAGASGLNRFVKGATVMEVPDITSWLRGGELIVTSLYALRADTAAQTELISELAAVNAAGLLVKTRFVEELGAEMIAAADRLSFPLIELPAETLYNDVLNAVMSAVFTRAALRRYADELVEDLIRGAFPSLAEVQRRARQVGWHASGPIIAAVIEIGDVNSQGASEASLKDGSRIWESVLDIVTAAAQKHHGLVGSAGRFIRLIFSEAAVSALTADRVRELLQIILHHIAAQHPHQPISAGIGEKVDSPLLTPRSFQSAARALQISRRLRGPGHVADMGNLGVYSLLVDWMEGRDEKASLMTTRGLECLLAYDRRHNGSLVATLRRYLDLQGNMRQTASALFVHYKTVRYRMQRVREITGWDLSQPELRLEVELQLRLLELYQTLPAP